MVKVDNVWYEEQPDMTDVLWFRASDGREICCNSGTVAARLMSGDPSFLRIQGPGNPALVQDFSEPIIVDLSWMTTEEQVHLASTILGLPSHSTGKDQVSS